MLQNAQEFFRKNTFQDQFVSDSYVDLEADKESTNLVVSYLWRPTYPLKLIEYIENVQNNIITSCYSQV